MNIIEIQNDLVARLSKAEGDLVILRNVTTSNSTSLAYAYSRIATLEQQVIELTPTAVTLPEFSPE